MLQDIMDWIVSFILIIVSTTCCHCVVRVGMAVILMTFAE